VDHSERAGDAGWLRRLLTGRGRWGPYRLALAVIVAIPFGIFGLIAADLAAWTNSTGCFHGEFLSGLESVAVVGAISGGVPALVAGIRRGALLPFAIGATGPGLIFIAYFFSYGPPAGSCP